MLTRRNILRSLLAAPLVITTPGLLMPLRGVIEPMGRFFSAPIYAGVSFIGIYPDHGPSMGRSEQDQDWVPVSHIGGDRYYVSPAGVLKLGHGDFVRGLGVISAVEIEAQRR